MEHIVQFAISIDDNTIAERVEKNAEKVIIESLERMVCNTLFETPYYKRNASPSDRPSEWMKWRIEEFLEAHREEIIAEAGKILANRLAKTKAAKETVGKVLEDLE